MSRSAINYRCVSEDNSIHHPVSWRWLVLRWKRAREVDMDVLEVTLLVVPVMLLLGVTRWVGRSSA